MTGPTLPRGVLSVHALPAGHHDGPWDSIVTPPGVKERLLGTASLIMRHGRRLATLPGPPSGLIVLAGPTGTGKTTLAQGLAQAAALAVADRGATTFVEIDPHAMPSEMLGESQRTVVRLLRDVVPELARDRPHLVVLAGHDADGETAQPGRAADQRLAVFRLEFVFLCIVLHIDVLYPV